MNKKHYPTIPIEREYSAQREKDTLVSSYFGEDTFGPAALQQKLPEHVYKKMMEIIHQGRLLDVDTANVVAHGMKEWAIEKGATHFCHWFQPMTGATAEKHDSFIELLPDGACIERFSGQQLVQGEPDASSFPSGGIRSTFEARGYTAWDPSSPAFILKSGLGTTLCIPSVYIAYSGEVLDYKTPLLRSLEALNKSGIKLLRALGNQTVSKLYATVGAEQEYFLIDQDFYYKRQDLLLTGRTLLGANPPKGQQLDDHYFGSIRERVLSFMHDAEEELYRLGIPAKTRHNEAAPCQFEIAPLYEEANLACDHNQLLMEVLKKTAVQHKLALLLHEKPFAGINGSGKHLNWSLADDAGNNLLNPGATPQDNVQFLIFLVAFVRAIHCHAGLLRAAVASAGNDHRLGANEAPPAIISVFLGDQLTRILDDIERGKATIADDQTIIDLGISKLPVLSRDNADRNRTAPVAFTGAKFEFRAVGSSQSVSWPAAILNAAVAESLEYLAEKIQARTGHINQVAMDVIKEEYRRIKPVLFMGDCYSMEWEQEAERRGLPNHKTSPQAFAELIKPEALKLLERFGVLSNVEVWSRYRIKSEHYCMELGIEAACLADMLRTRILPAAIKQQNSVAVSISNAQNVLQTPELFSFQRALLAEISGRIREIQQGLEKLMAGQKEAGAIDNDVDRSGFICREVRPLMEDLRRSSDALEAVVGDEIWPLPKYWEMLFIN
jgi:glutamine synthetase